MLDTHEPMSPGTAHQAQMLQPQYAAATADVQRQHIFFSDDSDNMKTANFSSTDTASGTSSPQGGHTQVFMQILHC